MEKGLWCYEANEAEPSHLNTASLAFVLQGDRVITLLHSLPQTQHTDTVWKLRAIGQYSQICDVYDHNNNVLNDFVSNQHLEQSGLPKLHFY